MYFHANYAMCLACLFVLLLFKEQFLHSEPEFTWQSVLLTWHGFLFCVKSFTSSNF